jgi:hypothetical protein
MISASIGNSWVVIEWANGIWLLAAFAGENLAVCAGGLPARPPFDWNINNVIPARQILMSEE